MNNSNGAEHLTLSVNGFRFQAFAQGPRDGELVLFLHGFPQFGDAWAEVMPDIAAAGFRTVAVDQRGYSPGARPARVEEYSQQELVADVLGFAASLGAERFHLAAHDWGGLLAWQVAAKYPDRVRSLSVLATPHTDAFFAAIRADADQQRRSQYIEFFRMPGGAAESYFQAGDWQFLRRVYQGKVPEVQVQENIRRLAEPGALTAALNWYRALDLDTRIGVVTVPTLFVWGTEDMAVGEAAAVGTAAHVTGTYEFERLQGRSHWLLEEVPGWIASRFRQHLEPVRSS